MGVLGGRDSGLEILHDGVGGDVEQGARTLKHIIVFAFDPISLNSLSLRLCKASFIIHIILACICDCALHNSYCHILYMLGCLCASLVPNQQELHIASQPISRGIKRS